MNSFVKNFITCILFVDSRLGFERYILSLLTALKNTGGFFSYCFVVNCVIICVIILQWFLCICCYNTGMLNLFCVM